MGFLSWIILGLIAGWIGSMIMKTNHQQGIVMDMVLGIVGAVIGGFLFNLFGGTGLTGFNLYSLFVAIIGSILVIGAGKTISRS